MDFPFSFVFSLKKKKKHFSQNVSFSVARSIPSDGHINVGSKEMNSIPQIQKYSEWISSFFSIARFVFLALNTYFVYTFLWGLSLTSPTHKTNETHSFNTKYVLLQTAMYGTNNGKRVKKGEKKKQQKRRYRFIHSSWLLCALSCQHSAMLFRVWWIRLPEKCRK